MRNFNQLVDNGGGQNNKKEKKPFELSLDNLKEDEMIKIEASGEKRENSLPILYISGWGETSKSTGPLLRVLAQDNDVISFNQPRDKRVDKSFAKKKFEGDFSALQLQKAFAAIETIEKAGYKEVDAVGASEGGGILVLAAYLAPEKFRNITLVEPVGMIGDDSFWRLAIRFGLKYAKQNNNRPNEQAEAVKIGKEDFNSFWRRNIMQSLKEIKEMSQADVVDMIAGLHKLGVGVSIVSHINSKVFDSDLMQKEISQRLVDESGDKKELLFDGLYTITSKRKNDEGEWEEYEGGHADIRYDKNFQKQLLTIVRDLADRKKEKD